MIDGTSGLRNDTDRIGAAQRLADTVVALLHVPNVAVYLEDGNDYSLAGDDGRRRLARTSVRRCRHRFVGRARSTRGSNW